MNRAQRRFEQRLRRPSGQFVSELSRRADSAAYQAALRSQMEEEANGAPIPPEIAAKMTTEKPKDELWQVGVTVRNTRKVMFLGPMMSEAAIRQIASDVNKQIIQGQRRDWMMADAYPMTPVEVGALA
jgi:hypothetical protein